MVGNSRWRWLAALTFLASTWFAVMSLAPVAASAASAGLVVVIANEYDGFLAGTTRDANAIADKLEADGFSAVRLLNKAGEDIAAGLGKVRAAALSAGPIRLVYVSGFGMCLNDDLVLFAEDMQPEQFQSGQFGNVAIPLSSLAEAVSKGSERILVVFDIDPNQCTWDGLNAIKFTPNSALLVTTGIGGDIDGEVGEEGMNAFTTAFLQEFARDIALSDIVANVIEQIRLLTNERQVPILVGEL